MATRPHDVSDLYLAPVVLAIDAKVEQLAQMDADRLSYEVALESDTPDVTRKMREDALIRTIQHMIDTHNWTLGWDPRGLRLSHDRNTLVLGIPVTFLEYLQGRQSA